VRDRHTDGHGQYTFRLGYASREMCAGYLRILTRKKEVLASRRSEHAGSVERRRRSSALPRTNSKFVRGLLRFLHDELHRLDVPDRVTNNLVVIMSRCLRGQAPLYETEYCRPVSDIAPRQRRRCVGARSATAVLQHGTQFLSPLKAVRPYTRHLKSYFVAQLINN